MAVNKIGDVIPQAQIQQAIGVESLVRGSGVKASREEEAVLRRIVGQRQRLEQSSGDAKPTSQARRAPSTVKHSFAGSLREASAPLCEGARAFVFRHPVSIGFTLGAGFVFGPGRIVRKLAWTAPLVWRGWQMAERGFSLYSRTTGSKSRRR